MKLQKQQFIGQALDTDIAHTDCRTCLLTKRHHSARTEGDNNSLLTSMYRVSDVTRLKKELLHKAVFCVASHHIS